jgi:hypothetical protein
MIPSGIGCQLVIAEVLQVHRPPPGRRVPPVSVHKASILEIAREICLRLARSVTTVNRVLQLPPRFAT